MAAAGDTVERRSRGGLAGRIGGAIRRAAASFGATRALALAFLAGLVVLRAWDPGPVELIRLKAFDFYQQLKPRVATERPVVIVDIDEASLTKYGQFPWPRTLVAQLLGAIAGSGSVAIGLDIVFAEPDRTSPDVIAGQVPGLSEAAREELAGAPNHDAVLAELMARARVVLGESALIDEDRQPDLSSVPETAYATLGVDPTPYLFTFPNLLPNIAPLEQAAAGRGMFAIKPDTDGLVRRVPLVMRASGRIMPALSLELLRVATGQRGFLIKANQGGVTSVVIAGVDVPTDRNARLWVHFAPHDPDRYIPAHEVLEGQVGSEKFAGKLVLVGTSASGLYDLRPTPLEAAMPGVEAHAQVIENILTNSYLQQPNYMLGAEIVAAVVAGIAIIMLVPVLGPLMVLGLGAVLAAGAAGASWYMFSEHGVLVDITFPLGATFAVFAFLVFINYYREEKQKQQIRGAFGQYLSPALVEELAEHPDHLKLGGETRELTILFTDVRGFTAISESFRNDPQGLTRLMNRFLTPLSNAIIDCRGTIDKYMGDAIMAFWNAPLDDGDHAANACIAALEMLERARALNDELREEAERAGTPHRELRVGVGINTGECVVGNMGSDIRFDYSVLGDSVNLASRLEGQTKDYGVRAIVGSATAGKITGRFALLELDLIRVQGKAEPERIYALAGGPDMARSAPFTELEARHQEMLAAYRAAVFDAALARLGECRALDSGGTFAAYHDMFEARIRDYRETPPPAGWDGVFDATHK